MLVLLAAPGGLTAAEPIDVEADSLSYDKDGGVLRFEGDVRGTWRDTRLQAGTLIFEREARRLIATGGVTLDTPEIFVTAESCDLDIDDETGELLGLDARMKNGGATFGGKRVRKHLGMRYTLKDGYFTTCMAEDGHEPDWELAGDKVDLELEGYGKIEGGTFRIKGVPVMYVPYALFPAQQQRTSGFMLPQFGASNERGFIYEQPFFWAIDKHQDVTLTADFETNERLGFGLDYRYHLRQDIEGEVEVLYFNEAIRDFNASDVESPLYARDSLPDDRAQLDMWHRQDLTPGLQLYADVLAVSDNLVLREIDSFGTNFFERSVNRSRRYTDSRTGVLGQGGYSSYGLGAAVYDDLLTFEPDPTTGSGFGDDDLVPQRPVRLWGAHDGDVGPLAFSVRGVFDQFLRQQGADGQRLDVQAKVERSLIRGLPLRSNAWVSGRVTGYHMDGANHRDNEGSLVRKLDDYAALGVFEAGIDLRTGVSRTFRLPGLGGSTPAALDAAGVDDTGAVAGPVVTGEGEMAVGDAGLSRVRRFASLRHTIEPFTAFRFTQDGTENDLPLYDGLDRVDDRTTATYGISSRILVNEVEEGGTAELARLSLAQTYNVDDEVLKDHFSDLDITAAVTPVPGMLLSGLASYNVGGNSLRGAAANLSVARFRLPGVDASRSRIDAIYRFVREGAVATEEDGLETIEGRMVLALSDVISVGFNGRYDFVSDKAVEKGGGVRLQSNCRCWAIDVGVIDRVNPDELEVRVQFELTGLASIGSSALSYSTPGLAAFDRGLLGARRNGW